jgi:predicted  nucleic acid-binding Zn-ribbon protein
MSNEVLFYTQLASIIAYVGSLFYLYQVLVSGKDATIQLLKEKTEWLQKELDIAKESSPDVLMQRLNDRVKVLTDEIERLSKDKVANEELIRQKDAELKQLEETINEALRGLTAFHQRLVKANEVFERPLGKTAVTTLKEKPPTN